MIAPKDMTEAQLVEATTEKGIEIQNAVSNLEIVRAEKVKLEKALLEIEEAITKARYVVKDKTRENRVLEKHYWNLLKKNH